MTHKLKTLPVYWDAVKRGEKTFEVRRDDRGFQKGDILHLVRHDGVSIVSPLGKDWIEENYTITKRISWILTGGQFGVEPGYVVLSLEDVAREGAGDDQA